MAYDGLQDAFGGTWSCWLSMPRRRVSIVQSFLASGNTWNGVMSFLEPWNAVKQDDFSFSIMLFAAIKGGFQICRG